MNGPGNSEIVFIYFIGTLGMVLLSGAIFFFFIIYQKRILKKELEINRIKSIQQEEIIKNTILAQEKERKRIARDLHDEVGSMLSVVKLNISLFERKADNQKSKALALETKSYIDDVILQVRRISRALMPPSLEKLGLAIAVEELSDWINKSNVLRIVYWCSRMTFRLESKKELAVFRIVQELMNNAIKHSGASQIQIKLRYSTYSFAVSVSDNGKGFVMDERIEKGLGLKNLESRTHMLNAKMKINSIPGKGTTAILCLNLQSETYG